MIDEYGPAANTISSLERVKALLKETSTAVDVMAKTLSEMHKAIELASTECTLSKWNLEGRIRFGADDDD